MPVALEAYRGCSWREKREVLAVFWRGKLSANPTINNAAVEYGRIAIGLVVAIALELIPIYVVSLHRGYLPGELAIGVEVATVLALIKAVVSYRSLRFAHVS